MKISICALSMLSAVSMSCAYAQNPVANTGKQIAASGAPNGIAACAGCHGAQGEGNAAAGFPRIAGQPQAYLARQLADYANGSRNHPVMTPIAKALTSQQINTLAAYYASLSVPSSSAQAPTAIQQQRGQALASVGDGKLGIQGCANCHGPNGAGEPPDYPYLAGQHGTYLTAALNEWKSGARNTDPSMQMSMIAKRLSDSDIAALAAYYTAQPSPQLPRMNLPRGSTALPAAGESGARANVTTPQGVGSEQGEATSGSSQGPGGGGGGSGGGPSGTPKKHAPY